MLVYLLSPNAKDKKVGNTSKLRETPKTCKIERFQNQDDKAKMSETTMDETRTCTDCNTVKPLTAFQYKKRKDRVSYRISACCKTCHSNKEKEEKKDYYQKTKERHATYNADPANKARRNQRNKERKKEDPMFRINESLKVRIHEVLKGYKNCRSSKLLACTRTLLQEWLAFNLEDGMTLDDQGSVWHIDHVIPVSFFDTTNQDEQHLCFHWSNLRPLQKSKNISKSNSIDEAYIKNHFNSIKRFCEINQGYQVDAERCLWQRFELWYGNNPQDDVAFNEQLKRAIRSHVPTPVTDEGMEKVQRLNASGLELANHRR